MSRRDRQRAAPTAGPAAKSRAVQRDVADAGVRVPAVFQAVLALAVAALVFFVYSPSVHGPFLFDDVSTIEQNTHVHVTSLGPARLLDAGIGGPARSRPVTMISFALNYYAHGLTTTGFHVVNIVIHLLGGFVFYYFVTLTLRLRPLRDYTSRATEIAFFAALIWLLHPLATQSVAYIVQRMTALSGLFYMVSLVAYVRGRLAAGPRARWAWFAACGLTALLALGSKETAITLPAVILLYEWYFFQDLSRVWLRRMSPVIAGIVVVGVVGLVWAVPWDAYGKYPFTAAQRLMSEARVVVYYLSLIALPHPSRLSVEYNLPISTSVLAPVTTLLSMALITGLLVLAWVTAKAHRLISFGILWYFGNLVLESTVIPLDLVFEHRTYVPSMGVALIAVALACRYVAQSWVRRAAFIAAAILLSVWTYQRTFVWTDELALWEDTVSKHPTVARAQFNLGRTRGLRNDLRGAIASYDQAIKLTGYGPAYAERGAAKKVLGDYAEAIADLTKAIEIDPRSANAYANRGNARRILGDNKGALEDEDQAIALEPNNADFFNNRGAAKQGLGDYPGAIDDYDKALALRADHTNAYANRGAAKVALRDYAGALADLTKVIELDPRLTNAYINRGHARHVTGDLKGSVEDFSQALAIDARSEIGYLNRAVARHDMKDYRGAVADYTALLALNPKFGRGFFNRAYDRLAIQDTKGACEDFRAAAQLGYAGADANFKKYCGPP